MPFKARAETGPVPKWIKHRCVSTNADVGLLAVVGDPGEIAGRDFGIEKTMEPRWSIRGILCEHVLYADDPLAIKFEFQIAGDARVWRRQRRPDSGWLPNVKMIAIESDQLADP